MRRSSGFAPMRSPASPTGSSGSPIPSGASERGRADRTERLQAKQLSRGCEPAAQARIDEVEVLRMATDVGSGERAGRDHGLAARADLIECSPDERPCVEVSVCAPIRFARLRRRYRSDRQSGAETLIAGTADRTERLHGQAARSGAMRARRRRRRRRAGDRGARGASLEIGDQASGEALLRGGRRVHRTGHCRAATDGRSPRPGRAAEHRRQVAAEERRTLPQSDFTLSRQLHGCSV